MAGSRKRLSTSAGAARRFVALALARGAALFFGVYSLANALATLRSTNPSADLWWIDTRFLPAGVAAGFALAAAIVLVAYGAAPRMRPWRRYLTVAVCAALVAVALQNVTTFYRLWAAGGFHPGWVFPLALVIAALFALLGWAVWSLKPPRKATLMQSVAAVVAALLLAALFPLAQIAFFGTSDYRAKADVAVVFGAKVNADGTLSTSLHDRMTTAISLHKSGLVKRLYVSGGVGSTGIDEAVAMKAAAVRAGVPASAVLVDHNGVDTDATVANTSEQFERLGIKRVLAVSQFYHLPRVKLAYLAEGVDVRTVPATTSTPIVQTPLYVMREVPAFWVYWFRALVRDVRNGGS